jgi:ribonucleoside-diphosphate reductase alpha chain
VNKVTSRGYIRKQGLVVYSNDGSATVAKSYDTDAETMLVRDHSTAITAAEPAAEVVVGAVADQKAELVKQARMQGYEGEACPECQNFTLVRNGTCLKCNTCGGTTGCS